MKKASYKQLFFLTPAVVQSDWAERVPISHTICALKANFLHEAVVLQGEFKTSSA
jgi:hypothetical protein